jgi:ribosome-associated heat shock protein Hsp15
LPGRALQTGQGTEDRRRVSDSLSIVRRGAPEAQALYAETDASIAKREAAAAMRKAGALGVSTDGKPSKKQRRDLFKFRGSSNDE